jgi:hypothetical protein
MHQPYNPLWFLGSFAVLLLALAVALLLDRSKTITVPRWALLLLAVAAALQLLLAGLLQVRTDSQLRQELQSIPLTPISNLVLSRAGITRSITNQAEVDLLLRSMQSLSAVDAHHSYPVDLVDVSFDSGGNHFHYRIGHDSQRPDEYWITEAGRAPAGSSGREIGRVESAQLGQILQRLMGGK